MKKYIVKEDSVATAENKNFAGETQIAYFGKEDTCLGAEGTHIDRYCPTSQTGLNMYMVKEYGYDTEAQARRNWTYRNPENSKWWKSTVSIIAVEV